MAIERVELLNHPLFFVNYRADWLLRLRRGKSGKKYPNKTASRREEKPWLKSRLDTYGRAIKEAKADKERLLIIVKVKFKKGSKTAEAYNRLLRHAKKELGERVIFLEEYFSPMASSNKEVQKVLNAKKDAEQKLSSIKFAKSIELTSGGEFTSGEEFKKGCVERSVKRLENIMSERGIKISKTTIKPSSLLPNEIMRRIKNKGEPTTIKFRKWRKKTYGKKLARDPLKRPLRR